MLDRLIASAPKSGLAQTLPSTVLSVVFHAAVIYAAVVATMGGGMAGPQAATDTTLVFLTPEEERQEEQQPGVRLEPVPGFVALVAPASIPTDIPPVNLGETFDPRAYSGVGQERPIAQLLGGGRDVGVSPAYAEAMVEERPEIMFSPPLRYPDVLRMAGIEGSVLVEVVIDTAGRAEPGSLRIVESTHRAFEPAAKDVVLKSVYRPGRMYGAPVRVLVQVPVSFSIRKPVA
ncbi:MAG: energy transducer TonB [Gemmatimonadetes bacterium]|nr:energy transducer TonB [Gemmatimonadota bacterium]